MPLRQSSGVKITLSYLVGLGQFMNTNKTVVVDSADKPNYIPNPQYDPIGYDNGRQATSGRHKSVNLRAIALLLLLVVAPSLLVCFWIKSFIEYRYLFDPSFKHLIDGSITAIIITTATSVAVTIVVGVLYVMGRVFKSGIVELPWWWTRPHNRYDDRLETSRNSITRNGYTKPTL
jgi:hypothetical protein